jgi:hypothetical protein
MCLAGILFSIEPILVSAITAKGYIGLEVKRQLLYVSVLLVGVFLGSYWGIIGVSAAVLVTSTIICVVLQRLVKRLIQIPWSEFAEVLWPAVLAGAVMSLGLFSYQEAAHTFLKLHSPAMLVSSVIVGFTCYGTSLFLIARWTDNHITRQMVEQLRSYGQLAYRLLH